MVVVKSNLAIIMMHKKERKRTIKLKDSSLIRLKLCSAPNVTLLLIQLLNLAQLLLAETLRNMQSCESLLKNGAKDMSANYLKKWSSLWNALQLPNHPRLKGFTTSSKI